MEMDWWGMQAFPESGERDYRSSKLHRASRPLLPLAGEGVGEADG